MVSGTGAKRTEVGTTVPTLTLKLTLVTRGALLLLMTVFLISVFCCVVRLTVALAFDEDDDADEAFEPVPLVPAWFDLPEVPLAEFALALSGEVSALELPLPAVEDLS